LSHSQLDFVEMAEQIDLVSEMRLAQKRVRVRHQ